MSKLHDVMAYICANYPYPDELSKARLTKMVYLVDWKHAVDYDEQLTEIQWVFNHFGPYVEDVYNLALTDPCFEVVQDTNYYGNPKEIIKLKNRVHEPSLTEDEIRIIEAVISATAPKNWEDFIQLVYSTYPILTQQRFTTLDLERLAAEYRKQRKSFVA